MVKIEFSLNGALAFTDRFLEEPIPRSSWILLDANGNIISSISEITSKNIRMSKDLFTQVANESETIYEMAHKILYGLFGELDPDDFEGMDDLL